MKSVRAIIYAKIQLESNINAILVVPAYDETQKVKKVKRTMQKSKEKQNETSQAHAECQSPHPCKKCRIMRRSGIKSFFVVVLLPFNK